VSAELKEYDKAIENLQELFEYIRTKVLPLFISCFSHCHEYDLYTTIHISSKTAFSSAPV
jgi:hypothetical protein